MIRRRALGVLLCACLFSALGAAAQETAPAQAQRYGDYYYGRPKIYTFITQWPGDFVGFGRLVYQKEAIPWIAATAGSTALLIWKDQYLVDRAYNLGNRLSIPHTTDQKTLFSIPVMGDNFAFGVPSDLGNGLYFIGDGWVQMGLAGGFLGFGLLDSNNRALQTSSEIVESLLTSGAVVQVLKHVTGREDPILATAPGGRWRFFPNQTDYHQHVPKYDAFPSGHLAAATAAFTVIEENYSEYWVLRPVGWTLLAVLGFQMMNNGVHWAGDYPLALALGWSFGHVAVQRGRTAAKPIAQTASALEFSPMLTEGGAGVMARFKF